MDGFFWLPQLDSNQRPIRSETLSPCFPWSGRNALCFFPFINLTTRSLNGQIYKPVNSRMRLLLHKVIC